MRNSETLERDKYQSQSPLVIEKTGLYTPFPVLAYRVLIAAREHIAKDVLVCLISHLGMSKTDNSVNPSYSTISRETRRARSSIASGIRTLVEFGFIKKWTGYDSFSKRKRSIYYIQESCYHSNKMEKVAIDYLPIVGRCKCGAAVKMGQYGIGSESLVHYSCGAEVKLLKSILEKRKKHSAVKRR